MSHTRREFMRDMAAAGAALTAGVAIGEEASADPGAAESPVTPERCPYFDQPMYCRGLSPEGKPMCER